METGAAAVVVANRSLPWMEIVDSIWFRLAFRRLMEFQHPYLVDAPYTVWGYEPPFQDLGARQAIVARAPDRLDILGYQIGPQIGQPGETVEIALTLQTAEGTTVTPAPFQALVRLISPVDGRTHTEWLVDLPQSVAPQAWQPQETIVERFPLPLPDDLEIGAYGLNLSLRDSETAELWPLQLDKDINQLDRIHLGDIVIPWSNDLAAMQPLEASFGEQVDLLGYAVSPSAPGEEVEVTLYWRANEATDQRLVVFVHVLNGRGELVAGHDGEPGDGRFPSTAWQAGLTIADSHKLTLPADLAGGAYQIRVGLYEADSGERLPATARDGSIAVENSLMLTELLIGE